MNLISQDGEYLYDDGVYFLINVKKNFIPKDYQIRDWIGKRVLIDEKIYIVLNICATGWESGGFLIKIK